MSSFMRQHPSLILPATPRASDNTAAAPPPVATLDVETTVPVRSQQGVVTMPQEAVPGQALALYEQLRASKSLNGAHHTDLFHLTAYTARVLPYPGPALAKRVEEAVRALKEVVLNQRHFRLLLDYAACALALLAEAPLHYPPGSPLLLHNYHRATTQFSDILQGIWARQQQYMGRAGVVHLLTVAQTSVDPCRLLWSHLKDLGDSIGTVTLPDSPARRLLHYLQEWPDFKDEAGRVRNFMSSLRLTQLKDLPEPDRAPYHPQLNAFLEALNTRRLHPHISDRAVDEALALERSLDRGLPPGPHWVISHPDLRVLWYRAWEGRPWVTWREFWAKFPSHLPQYAPSCPDIAHIQTVLATAERRRSLEKAVCPWGGPTLDPYALHLAFPAELDLALRIQHLVVSSPVQGVPMAAAAELPEVKFEVQGVLKELRIKCTRETVLVLQGPPGAGKWTVAAAMGQALRREVAGADVVSETAFPGGVWYADLKGATTEEEMWARICAAFGVPMGRQRDPTAVWLRMQRISFWTGALLLVLHSVEDILRDPAGAALPGGAHPGMMHFDASLPGGAEKRALSSVIQKVHAMAKTGRVILTMTTTGEEAPPVILPPLRTARYEMRLLQPGSAVALLKRQLPWVEGAALKDLAEGCQRHPQTLHLVAAALSSGTSTVDEVQEMIKVLRPSVDAQQLGLKERLVHALVPALPITHQDVLRNLTLLPSTFTYRQAADMNPLSEAGMRAVLAVLCERGLVQVDPYTSSYRLHPTVARFVLSITTPLDPSVLQRQQTLALETLAAALSLHHQSHTALALQLVNSNRGVLAAALQRFCTEPSPLATPDAPHALRLLEVLGESRELLVMARLWRAEAMERGWSMVASRGGELGWLGSLAHVYRGQALGEVRAKAVKDALEHVSKGLAELARHGGEELRFARGLEVKADLEIRQKAAGQAEKDLMRAYKVRDRALRGAGAAAALRGGEPRELQLCRPLLRLAEVKLEVEEVEAARSLLDTAHKLLNDSRVSEHEVYVRVLELSAQVAEAGQEWDSARALYTEVLQRRGEVGAAPLPEGYPADPSPEVVMQRLAGVAVAAGQLEEAEQWCRKGLALLEGFWGSGGSREVAEAVVRLAHTVALRGDRVAGLGLHHKAVEVMEALHPNTPELAAMQLHQAQVLASFDEWEGAVHACRSALEIRETLYLGTFGKGVGLNGVGDVEASAVRKIFNQLRRSFGRSGDSSRGLDAGGGHSLLQLEEHDALVLDIAAARKQLAEACVAVGKLEEAARLLGWVTEVQEMVLGSLDLELASTWLQLSAVHERRRQRGDAEAACLRCTDILQRGESLLAAPSPERYRELRVGALKAQARGAVEAQNLARAEELLRTAEAVEADTEAGVREDTWEARASVLLALGRYPEADSLWFRVAERRSRDCAGHLMAARGPQGGTGPVMGVQKGPSQAARLCEAYIALSRVREMLDPSAAEKVLAQAISMCENLPTLKGMPSGVRLRDLHLRHADLCRRMSVAQRDASLCQQAQESYQKALAVADQPACGSPSEQAGVLMVAHLHLADVLFAQQQHALGDAALQRCLEILQGLAPKQYPIGHVAFFLLSLGNTLGTLGLRDKSKTLYESCLWVMELAGWGYRPFVEQATAALHGITEAAGAYDALGALHLRKSNLLALCSHPMPPTPPTFHWLPDGGLSPPPSTGPQAPYTIVAPSGPIPAIITNSGSSSPQPGSARHGPHPDRHAAPSPQLSAGSSGGASPAHAQRYILAPQPQQHYVMHRMPEPEAPPPGMPMPAALPHPQHHQHLHHPPTSIPPPQMQDVTAVPDQPHLQRQVPGAAGMLPGAGGTPKAGVPSGMGPSTSYTPGGLPAPMSARRSTGPGTIPMPSQQPPLQQQPQEVVAEPAPQGAGPGPSNAAAAAGRRGMRHKFQSPFSVTASSAGRN